MVQTFTDTKSILTDSEHRMQKAVDATKNELQTIRTGRANAALVEGIQVDYYGSRMALKGVAAITVPDAKTIMIQPWDQGAIPAIEKAIQESGLGLTPQRDGHVIRLPIPALTDERRQELDKVVRKSAEEGRISIRNVRHEANEAVKKLEKAKTIGEDISKGAQKKNQELTDKYIQAIDDLLVKKEQELVG